MKKMLAIFILVSFPSYADIDLSRVPAAPLKTVPLMGMISPAMTLEQRRTSCVKICQVRILNADKKQIEEFCKKLNPSPNK